MGDQAKVDHRGDGVQRPSLWKKEAVCFYDPLCGTCDDGCSVFTVHRSVLSSGEIGPGTADITK